MAIVGKVDEKMFSYKRYLRGQISAPLLLRMGDNFWSALGVEDGFDRLYIISQIEKFCHLFGLNDVLMMPTVSPNESQPQQNPNPLTRMMALPQHQIHRTLSASPTGTTMMSTSFVPHAAMAVAGVSSHQYSHHHNLPYPRPPPAQLPPLGQDVSDIGGNMAMAGVHAHANIVAERMGKKRKATDDRGVKKRLAQEQKEEAFSRAAELLNCNHVPIGIVEGPSASFSSMSPPDATMFAEPGKRKKQKKRSSIIVSTAEELDTIVTNAQNLFDKYTQIARNHNQRVTWQTVSSEIGINVKVREKYARYHVRAKARGFNFKTHGHVKIKDYPEIFMHPLAGSSGNDETAASNVEDDSGNEKSSDAPTANEKSSNAQTAEVVAVVNTDVRSKNGPNNGVQLGDSKPPAQEQLAQHQTHQKKS